MIYSQFWAKTCYFRSRSIFFKTTLYDVDLWYENFAFYNPKHSLSSFGMENTEFDKNTNGYEHQKLSKSKTTDLLNKEQEKSKSDSTLQKLKSLSEDQMLGIAFRNTAPKLKYIDPYDYEWYDPYETESLFTTFQLAPGDKGIVELVDKNVEDNVNSTAENFWTSVYYAKKPWLVMFYRKGVLERLRFCQFWTEYIL